MYPCRIFSVNSFTPLRKKLSGIVPLWIALGLLSVGGAKADQIGHYEFSGNFNNSITDAGALGALTPVTTGVSGFDSRGWYWEPGGNSGLEILSGLSLQTFSIGIDFTFADINGYRKFIDFGNLLTDTGLYVYYDEFIVYLSGVQGSGGVASADTTLSIILTRNSAGELNLYQRGSETPIASYTDGGNLFTINNRLAFFLDDSNGSEYSSAGSVSLLRVWNTELTPEEVTAAFQAIPEPGTLSLLAGAGVASLAFRQLRRKRRE